jgi:CheY-like chemotaxis protein
MERLEGDMKKKILIVDDEADQVFTVQKSIEASSDEFEVFSATSGEQSIEFLQKHELPDLILLDIMMPQMDGIEVIKKIRENPVWSHIPVVFLTARTDKLSIEDSMDLGDDYLEKPFDIDDLMKRIQKAVGSTHSG